MRIFFYNQWMKSLELNTLKNDNIFDNIDQIEGTVVNRTCSAFLF